MRSSSLAEVNRERVLLVGGQRALVMQLAHPLVAAGVDDHSDFPAAAFRRLRRTLDLSLALIYGDPSEAGRAAASIRAVHDRVVGDREGVPYAANHPALLVWVNATLVDTTLVTYERFVRPLSEGQRARYYGESLEAASGFGIPADAMPRDLAAFRRYMDGMLEGSELRATPSGARLVGDVLRPPLAIPLRPPAALLRRVTLALLPERIREMFGLRSGQVERSALGAMSAASRAALPWIPPILREFSRARRAGLRG